MRSLICLIGLCGILVLCTSVVAGGGGLVPLPPGTDKAIEDAHNKFRMLLGVKTPIRWNQSVAEFAKKRALHQLETCKVNHDGLANTGYGENGFGSWGGDGGHAYTPAEIAKFAADWGTNERYRTPLSLSSANHASQMAWSGSTSVGCAAASNMGCEGKPHDYHFYLMCNYFPPGNMGGVTYLGSKTLDPNDPINAAAKGLYFIKDMSELTNRNLWPNGTDSGGSNPSPPPSPPDTSSPPSSAYPQSPPPGPASPSDPSSTPSPSDPSSPPSPSDPPSTASSPSDSHCDHGAGHHHRHKMSDCGCHPSDEGTNIVVNIAAPSSSPGLSLPSKWRLKFEVEMDN